MSLIDEFRLDGRVVVITGASAGLGVAAARGLAEVGAKIVLGARRVDALADVARRLEADGREVAWQRCDVTDPDDCSALVALGMERFGAVNVLVNNAGVGRAVPALKETPDSFREIIDVNLLGAYWMAQACGRVMQPGSSIVNVGSVLALTTAGLPQAGYVASKAGLLGLTRDLAQQWTGRRGIRVNALAPGFFATEMTEEFPDGYVEETVSRRVLAGRIGELMEYTAALLFLASPASSYVTGAVLPVDGGLLLT